MFFYKNNNNHWIINYNLAYFKCARNIFGNAVCKVIVKFYVSNKILNSNILYWQLLFKYKIILIKAHIISLNAALCKF